MLCMLAHLLHRNHEGHGDVDAHQGDPVETARARYARGEITEDQFRHMVAVLSETRGPANP